MLRTRAKQAAAAAKEGRGEEAAAAQAQAAQEEQAMPKALVRQAALEAPVRRRRARMVRVAGGGQQGAVWG